MGPGSSELGKMSDGDRRSRSSGCRFLPEQQGRWGTGSSTLAGRPAKSCFFSGTVVVLVILKKEIADANEANFIDGIKLAEIQCGRQYRFTARSLTRPSAPQREEMAANGLSGGGMVRSSTKFSPRWIQSHPKSVGCAKRYLSQSIFTELPESTWHLWSGMMENARCGRSVPHVFHRVSATVLCGGYP